MQVVILAAGMGRRLNPLTNTTPKCLIEVNGVPIIVNALNILTKYNVTRIVIVVGHMADLIKKRIGKKYNGVPIRYIKNPAYDKTNNIYSFWLAKKVFDQNTVLMECDVHFEEEIIKKLFSRLPGNIALVDKMQPYMDGTVVEVSKDNKINRLIPSRDQDEDFSYKDKYKTINIYSFTKEYLRDVFVPGLDVYIKTSGRQQYYELILGALIYLGDSKIEALSVDGAKWVEIDDFVDLERAEHLFSNRPELFKKINKIFGGYWRYDFLDFSYLYNMHFPPPQLINELKINLNTLIRNYPSGSDEIHENMANWIHIDPQYLVVGNGASEIISAFKRSLVKKMTIPFPTFNEYETQLNAKKINAILLDYEDHSFHLDAYIDSVKQSGSNVALIINPNNPTSYFLKTEEIKYILKSLSYLDCILIDESFIDFVSCEEAPSMIGELERFYNLVIIRSLSKDLGIPGLRLGYAASANIKILETLKKEMPIWNINSIAQYLLSILPKYRRVYEESCQKVIKDRDDFYEQLSMISGIKTFRPNANFIFVKLKNGIQSGELKKYLFTHSNILIKDCSNKTGLEGNMFLRISVRTKKENDYFITAFKGALKALLEKNKAEKVLI